MAKTAPYDVVSFHTTASAMEMRDAGTQAGLLGRLAPIPRSISAGCGFAWLEPAENSEGLQACLQAFGISYEAITRIDL